MIIRLLRSIITFFFEIAETAILAVLIFLALYLFLVRPHQIRGDSMLPNFHNGEYLLTEMVSYNLLKKEPQRGEVIVFRSPEQPSLDFIKRVIALPNEKVKLENGKVFVINQEHPEGFLLEEDYLEEGTGTEGRRTIKDGEVFSTGDNGYVVMGDNRERSSDSREWGVIGKENIIGRVWLRYWPPEAVALIKPALYIP
jgi:signal peptidase I